MSLLIPFDGHNIYGWACEECENSENYKMKILEHSGIRTHNRWLDVLYATSCATGYFVDYV